MTTFLTTTTPNAIARLLLAHGAGAAMDSSFLDRIAALFAERHIETWRFEFPYMAARREGGKKRPPPKAETLNAPFLAALREARAQTASDLPWFIGGKSMGGRVASMIAAEAITAGEARGCICLGYPFHPPNQPQTWRIGHLVGLRTPLLIVQGERDPFGTRAEIETLVSSNKLPQSIAFSWIGDGDHDFGPRGGRGFTRKGNLAAAADAVAAFVTAHTSISR